MAKIYVANSWKNTFQQDLVKFLQEQEHEVYDFKTHRTDVVSLHGQT